MINVIGTTNSPNKQAVSQQNKQAVSQPKTQKQWMNDEELREYRRQRNVAYSKRHPKQEKPVEEYVSPIKRYWNQIKEFPEKVKAFWSDDKVNDGFQDKKTTFECFATIRQDVEEDEEIPSDAEVSTKLLTPPKPRRPHVVCNQESKKTEDQKLRSRLERLSRKPRSKKWWKKQRAFCEKLYPSTTCPFTKIPQKDCWCLQKKDHAEECNACGSMYRGYHDCGCDQYDWDDDSINFDPCYSVSCSDSDVDSISHAPGLTPTSEELQWDDCGFENFLVQNKDKFELNNVLEDFQKWKVECDHDYPDSWGHCPCQDKFKEQMPDSDNESEYNPCTLIHVYLKEVVWNIHNMIGLWTHEHLCEIREHCISLLARSKKMDALVGGSFYMGDKSNDNNKTLQQQKELMFVYTSNIAIRLNQCNKIVNDSKELHKIRPSFLAESRAAKVEVGSIRTMVNEARFIKCEEQMEAHGDSDFCTPHSRQSNFLAIANDKSKDETAMFGLGKQINITSILDRCKIPSRLDVIPYTTTSTAGTVLARYRVSPNYCPRYVDAATRTYNQTALCNYANIFQFWKGSLIYTFEVVRTPFHMGQIMIAFNPASVAAPTFSQCSNLIYKIMDLKEKNRMDFEVEYVGETEFKKCVSSVSGPAVPADPYVNIANVGTLNVFAFTPLLAPTLVAPTVEINVYVRAGDNFEFDTPTHKTTGLSYYNVRGAIFEQMETEYDTELVPVTAQPPEGTVSSAENFEKARAAKLKTADTFNIGMRKYPLTVGIAWSATDTIVAPLSITPLPRAVLTAANLSINGLINYHAFFRGKFTMIWEMNAPLQYSGLLIMFYVPDGVDYTNCANATWTQFPHVFFNPANETIAELDIPWSYVTPMQSLDPNGSSNTMGRVYIHPWNNLQIPVGGANTLTGSLSFKMNDPEIVVKRTNYTYALRRQPREIRAEEQMGEPVTGGSQTPIKQTSGTAKKEEDSQGVFQGKPVTMKGMMFSNHMNIYNLLKRVDFVDPASITVPTTAVWTQLMTLPPFFGAMHNFLRNSFAFSNGSNKVTFIVPVGANRGVTLAAYPSFYDADFSDTITSTPATVSSTIFYQGTAVWRPGLRIEHTETVPFQHRDPVISIPNNGNASQCEYANMRIAAFNNDTATSVFVQPCHSIGDDFKLYFPVAFGSFRSAIPALDDEDELPLAPARPVPVAPPVREARPILPPEFQSQLPKPPTIKLPGMVVRTIVDHIAEQTGVNKDVVRDIGASIMHARGHHDMADAMAESLGMHNMLGMRRKRDVQTCPDCPEGECKWPLSVPIPYKETTEWDNPNAYKVNGQIVRSFAPDYDNVHVHCHATPTLVIQDMIDKIKKCGKIEEQMPAMGGFSGVTTNSQVISQAFPGLATVGVVNTFQFNAIAVCTSNVATDLVDLVYTIGNVTESITFIQTVVGTQLAPAIINMTFPATPTNTLINFTVTATGTGVIEHACTMSAYTTPAATGTIPVSITGQPIRVTEYANLMSSRRKRKPKFVEQMPDVFVDASENVEPTEDEEEEAEMMARNYCNEFTEMAWKYNPVSVFCNAFTGIQNMINSKCGNVVKKRTCDKIRERLSEISDNVLDKILPVVIWVIDFIANLYVLFNTQSSTMRALMIASLSAKCVLAYREGSQLVDKLEELFGIKEGESIKAEFHAPEMPENFALIAGVIASTMVAGILGVLGKSVLSSDVTDIRKLASWKFAESCAMLSKINSGVKALPSLWTAADSGIKTAINFFIEGPDCFKNWEQKNHEKLVQWQRDYDEAIKENLFVNAGLFKYKDGKTNYQRLTEMTNFATEVRVHGSAIPHFNHVWLRTASECVKLHATAEKLITTSNGRSEPVGIILRGEAGCGKSLLFSQFLPHAVMLSLELSKSYKESQQKTYAKPTDPKADFWDGYLGEQHVWVNIDDFGQARTEEDIGSIYNLISSSDAPVNMAELTDKGILFKSDFVCCTTNLANFTCLTSIRHAPALVRRFPIALASAANKKYVKKDGTLDHAKMIDRLKIAPSQSKQFFAAMDDIWTFTVYNFSDGSVGRVMPISEVVQQIVEAYQHRKRGLTDFTALMEKLTIGGFDNVTGTSDLTIEQQIKEAFDEQMPTFGASAYDDSDDDDYPPMNPLECRRNFIARVLDSVGNDWKGLTYEKARKFLRELRYIDTFEQYKVSKSELDVAVDEQDRVIRPTSYMIPDFLVVYARLKQVSEDKVERGPKPERWEGLVKFMLKWMGIISVGVVTAMLLKKILTMLFHSIMRPLTEEQGPQYDGSKALRTRAPARIPIVPKQIKAVQHMPGPDEKQMIVSGNIRFIRISYSGIFLRMQCIALDSKYIVFPEHFYVAFVNDILPKDPLATFELEVRRKTNPELSYIPIAVTVHNSIQLEGVGDLAGHKLDGRLVYLQGQVCVGAKSIWNHVCNVNDMAFYSGSEQQGYIMAPQTGLLGQKVIVGYKKYQPFKNRMYLLGKCAVNTIKGECGRPYVHASKHAQHCLLGIHTLGVEDEPFNVGMCPLVYESLEIARNVLSSIYPPVLHVEPLIVENMPGVEILPVPPMIGKLWNTPSMPLLGAIKINGSVLERFTPTNTKYLPIKIGDKPFIHPNWTNEFLPSRKTSVTIGDKIIHPLFTGAQKYAQISKWSPPPHFSMNALNHYKTRLPVDREARVLTDEEALNGYETMGHMVMSTGAGYWGTWFSKGKSEIFTPKVQTMRDDGSMAVLEYEWSDKAKKLQIPVWKKTIVEFYRECDEDIQNGQMMKTFWVSTLKDELVSIEKNKIAKTRVFEQPCVVYTLLCRKYFGYFSECFKRHAGLRLHHGIGKDANVVWGRYLELLRQYGDYGFDIDYKNYDGTVHPAAFEFFLQVTDMFYGTEGRQARHSLIRTLQCSHHLIGSTIAESGQGNKSGNPLTDLFNSITNTWLVYVVFQCCQEAHGLDACLDVQPELFGFLTYGDDVILTATEECLVYFNRITFATFAELFGYTVTAADKTAALTPGDNIFDLTFLKRPFAVRHGYIAAPLPKKVIYRELTWETNICVGNKTIFDERVKNALEFMAHHGHDEYQKLRLELAQLGVKVEDRFDEWETAMRVKQLYPEVEDDIGRTYVESDELFLDERMEVALEIDWEGDDWLYSDE